MREMFLKKKIYITDFSIYFISLHVYKLDLPRLYKKSLSIIVMIMYVNCKSWWLGAQPYYQ